MQCGNCGMIGEKELISKHFEKCNCCRYCKKQFGTTHLIEKCKEDFLINLDRKIDVIIARGIL